MHKKEPKNLHETPMTRGDMIALQVTFYLLLILIISVVLKFSDVIDAISWVV